MGGYPHEIVLKLYIVVIWVGGIFPGVVPVQTAGNTSGLLKWGTMINHSCRANVTFHSVKVGREFEGRYRAVRPIRKGDVLGSLGGPSGSSN